MQIEKDPANENVNFDKPRTENKKKKLWVLRENKAPISTEGQQHMKSDPKIKEKDLQVWRHSEIVVASLNSSLHMGHVMHASSFSLWTFTTWLLLVIIIIFFKNRETEHFAFIHVSTWCMSPITIKNHKKPQRPKWVSWFFTCWWKKKQRTGERFCSCSIWTMRGERVWWSVRGSKQLQSHHL